MQVHTFIAESANDAVERIRSELGPAAVVLSVRKLPRTGLDRFLKQDQIEVLAGVDPVVAETIAAEPERTANPLEELREEIRELRRQVSSPAPLAKPTAIAQILNQTGILPSYAEQVLQELPELDRLTAGEQIAGAAEVLRSRWRVAEPHTPGSVHIFIGVPGSGKSTVLCKMLAQASLVGGEPATVYQLDAHVANASPQPGVYAEIVGAQFERTLPVNFEREEESVFVDLPGVALNDHSGLRRLRELIAEFGIPELHLVLNAAYETSHLLDQARFFASLGISDLILTHLDEEPRWGKVWNLVFGTNFSIRSLCDGQNIPGDFREATPDLILSRQFRGK